MCVHVGIGAKPDSLESSIWLGHDESTVARYLVPSLIVNELRRRQAPAIFRNDDHVLARDHVAKAGVVRPPARCEHRILCTGGVEKNGVHLEQLDARVVLEEIGCIRRQSPAVEALVIESEPGAKHHLISGVGHRRPTRGRQRLFLGARTKGKQGSGEAHGGAH